MWTYIFIFARNNKESTKKTKTKTEYQPEVVSKYLQFYNKIQLIVSIKLFLL